jgi:hypothetical protein
MLYGWYENNDHVFLAMEYFPYGDLQNYIIHGITEDSTKIICTQLLDGLRLMHSIGLTHRDLKPQVGLSLVYRNLYFYYASDHSRLRISSSYLWNLGGGLRSETLAFQGE